jgi:MFS family permease
VASDPFGRVLAFARAAEKNTQKNIGIGRNDGQHGGGLTVAQTIEGFVGNALDNAKISPLHRRIVGLIAAGYFFDVIDFTIFGSMVPFILGSKFASGAEVAAIGSATIFGMCIGTAGQGQFSDRFGRRFIYQFNLLLFGVFTILGAFAPSVTLLIVCRFIAGIGLGAEQPLAFAYAGEYSPKAIRGRILAIVHFIGGACVWPIGTLMVLAFSGARYARACLARHLADHRHRRIGCLGVPLHPAGIAALFGDARPGR